MPPEGAAHKLGEESRPFQNVGGLALLHALLVVSFEDGELMCLQPPGRSHASLTDSPRVDKVQVVSASLPLPQDFLSLRHFLKKVRSWKSSVLEMSCRRGQACVLETPPGGEGNSMTTRL